MGILAVARAQFLDPNLRWYATLVLLSVGVVVGVPWALWVWKGAKGDLGCDSDTAEGLLGPLEEAYASGQMSDEEYQRIRSSVVKVAPLGRLSDLSYSQVKSRATEPPEPLASEATENPPDS